MADLPPQTAIINNTNQSGGTNIGILNINQASTPREVTQEQAAELKKLANGTPQLTVSFSIDTNVPDAARYAQSIATALAQAGFKINTQPVLMTATPAQQNVGIRSTTTDPTVGHRFAELLTKVGIKVSPIPRSGISMETGPADTPPGVTIIVGQPSQ